MTGTKLKRLLAELNPHSYSDAVLAMWLTQVENALLVAELLLSPTECVEYEEMPDADLLVPKPFDKLYLPYMQAMIAHANGEMAEYENYLALYEAYRTEYARHICEVVRPAYGAAVKMGYYLSAYQLAVAAGFKGSAEEWLTSLHGRDGRDGDRGPQGGDGYLDMTEQWEQEQSEGLDEQDLPEWLVTDWADGAYCVRTAKGLYEMRQETLGDACRQVLRCYTRDGSFWARTYVDEVEAPELRVELLAGTGQFIVGGEDMASEEFVREQTGEERLGHVTPQMFGAKADGMSDDTQAIIDALAASDNVLIPAGRYRITRPIWVQQGKSLRGVGAVTILICDGAGGAERFIMLSATVRFGKMLLQVRNGEAVAEEITINEESLADVRLPSGHIDTIVDDVIVMYDDADYTDNAVLELSLKNEYGEKGKDGFWGVTIKDVTAYGNGSLGYLLRGYTLGTTEQGKRKYFITGITMERCIAYGCRWSQFLHDSDKDFSNLGETWGIDHITSIRCMHQATERTKGFSFYRHDTNAQLTDCVPWDWHYPEGDFKNRPYWFDSGRLSNDSCEMDINVGSLHGEKFGFIYPNGETKLLHYWDQYAVLKNIGVREIITDSLPLQMPLSDGTNKATCIFFAKNPVILSGTSSKYCFLRFRFVDGRHMSEDVTVFLHPEKPVIHASRWATSHKLGYTMVDGEFRLYMYNLSKYSYVISEAISNTTAGYSGTAVTSEYNKTINTFGLPYEERYLSELPAELTEITDIQAVFVERDKLKSLLPGWSTQDKKPAYTPEEVGAAAKVHGHSYNELADKPEIPVVPSWAMQGEKPSYNATEVGADAVGTAAGAVAAHNAADDAHNDIRLQLKEVADRLNALADTDDETLDQVSEIVAYIKSNKALIDAITTKKVNVSDIVDNLTTSTADKPLSAKQGVALKKLIEEIIVPTKVSQLENDTGYLTSAPVASVNGKTGVVKLNATDVGARPDNWMPTAQNVGAVPVNETVTLVGVDANGVSHTWIIYGKKVM